MNILYGVQGTGNGHTTRARTMALELQKHGLEVQFLFSGRAQSKLFDMEAFGDYHWRQGLTFQCKNSRINYLGTALEAQFGTFIRDVNSLDVQQYDLVISDFEPVTAWAARWKKVPSLGIGHQYAFEHNIPTRGSNPLSRWIMCHYAPVSHSIGLHWHNFNQPILPPIVDNVEPGTVQANKILVYLPCEDIHSVCRILGPLSAYEFYLYSNDRVFDTPSHIQLKPLSRNGFQKDMLNCAGIISNAGFELPSEALQLGKKILVKPLRSQMEQLSNAFALDQLGYGQATHQLNTTLIENWLVQEHAVQITYPNVAAIIARWLTQGVRPMDQDWIRQAWDNVRVTRTQTEHITHNQAA